MTIVHWVSLAQQRWEKEGVLYRCGQNPHNFRLVDSRRMQGDRDMVISELWRTGKSLIWALLELALEP